MNEIRSQVLEAFQEIILVISANGYLVRANDNFFFVKAVDILNVNNKTPVYTHQCRVVELVGQVLQRYPQRYFFIGGYQFYVIIIAFGKQQVIDGEFIKAVIVFYKEIIVEEKQGFLAGVFF
jgi:hypothetical protein